MKEFNEFWMKQILKALGNSKSVFINPIRKIGVAYFSFQALSDLEVNKWHSVDDVILHVKELMRNVTHKNEKTCWEVFCKREVKQSNDVSHRIFHSLMSLQCLYGERLSEMHSCVEIRREVAKVYIRLNTYSVNPLKKRGCSMQVKEKKSLPSQLTNFFKSVYVLLMGIFY